MIVQGLLSSYPVVSAGAIALDNSTDGGLVAGNSQTFSHTCSGSNRILFVGAFSGSGVNTITGITYGGVAMTKIASVVVPSDRPVTLFYLIAPTSGANNVVITADGSSDVIQGMAVSYTGAKQSGQPDAFVTNTATSSTNITGTLTTINNNCWTIAVTKVGTGQAPSAGTGTTNRKSSTNGIAIGDSNGPLSIGSKSQQFTLGSNQNWAISMASFQPV